MPEIHDWDVDRVDLKWKPPKDDGGAPITGYIIEQKEKFGTSWEPVVETKVRTQLRSCCGKNCSFFSTLHL